jgi:hypothetical protein
MSYFLLNLHLVHQSCKIDKKGNGGNKQSFGKIQEN